MNQLSPEKVPVVQPRARLLRAVDRALAQGDLLIVGGAGFGKRALMRGWCSQQTALDVVRPGSGDPLPDPGWPGVVIAGDMIDGAATMLGAADRRWRLVLIAGQSPAWDLSIPCLNGTLTILDADQLRMDGPEVAALLPSASRSAIAQVLEMTGGWPIAVQALVRHLAGGPLGAAEIEGAFAGLSAAIFDFCENHVLATATPEQRAHLIAICLMTEIDLPLADRLAGEGQGAAALETGLGFGLIRRMPQHGARWQVCHPVLSRHLRQMIARERGPDAQHQLHSRAADYFERTGETEPAIHHAHHAGNGPLVARLVERAGGWRIAVDWRNRQSQRDWLHHCVEDLPETLVEQSPALRLARAMLRFCCGEIRRALRDYEHLATRTEMLGHALALEIAMVGQLMRMLEERPPTDENRRIIEDCLERIPSTDLLGVALMENALTIAAAQRGETEDALESGERARRLYVRLGARTAISVVGLVQGRACADAGMRNMALSHYQASLETFEQHLGFNADLARCARLLIGQEVFAGNDLTTARSCLADALPWIEAQEPQFYAAAYLTSTRLAVLDRGLEAGADIIDTCIRFAQRRGLRRLERLAQICWLEQLCGAEEGVVAARLAAQVGLEALVTDGNDRMLALAATLVLAEIDIVNGDPAAAETRLAAFRQSGLWLGTIHARAHWHVLTSLAAARRDDPERSLLALEEALRCAVPEGLSRLFIARGRDIHPLLREHQRVLQGRGRFANHAEEDFVAEILASVRRERRSHRLAVEGITLTEKEEEIADLLTRGLSNKEISRLIGASDNTVKWHLKNLFRLFNVTSRNDLVTSYQINLKKRTDHNAGLSLTSFRLH
ncbi:LuxR C-terminal-related transcriptional regulator [Niveispirillum sp.]|uniref:helix-turn-helix transcriptional regulator n=1 Tax=Niveispirillum sp. TaxID=1917217 RepID=UPI001B4F5259|nr:LuxR C-terminal-related transcriptional regulator [Niveispirillum sp.]MBP7338915.1 hypothetical protein [Niveispirillum sp.]